MRIGICLTQCLYSKEHTFVSTFDIRCFKPPIYFEIVAYVSTSCNLRFATHRDITTYRNVTIYLCCLY